MSKNEATNLPGLLGISDEEALDESNVSANFLWLGDDSVPKLTQNQGLRSIPAEEQVDSFSADFICERIGELEAETVQTNLPTQGNDSISIFSKSQESCHSARDVADLLNKSSTSDFNHGISKANWEELTGLTLENDLAAAVSRDIKGYNASHV